MTSRKIMSLPEALRAALGALEPLRTTLPTWYEGMSHFLDGAAHERLRVGVVGVTSSGKSALINGLLGEVLLPEQSKATTNIPVICRKGPHRRLTIYGENSETEHTGDAVTAALIHDLCSEDGNPGNAKRLLRLELELPSCCLPEELEVIDTPGTDAYGLPAHEERTLRRCLTISDIVIFMTQIRRPFAASDARLLANVIGNDQRVLFVISHSDIERDDHQGGELQRSRQNKLENHVANLAKDLASLEYPGLKKCGIVAVSSALAQDARGDQASAAWRESNFGTILTFLTHFVADLGSVLVASRLERMLAVLTRVGAEVAKQVPELERRAHTSSEEEDAAKATEALERAERAGAKRIERLRAEVTSAMDLSRRRSAMRAELAAADPTDVSEMRRVLTGFGNRWEADTAAQLRQLDLTRKACREALEALNLPPGRQAAKRHDLSLPRFPTLDGKVKRETHRYTVSVPRTSFFGRMVDSLFGVRTEQRTRAFQVVDIEAVKEEIAAFLSSATDTFLAFVNEEIDLLTKLYVDPIRDQRVVDSALLRDLRALRGEAASDLAALPQIAARLREIVRRLPRGARVVSEAPEIRSPFAPAAASAGREAASDARAANPGRALRTIFARVREAVAIETFWRTAQLSVGVETPLVKILVVSLEGRETVSLLDFLARSTGQDSRGGPAAGAFAEGRAKTVTVVRRNADPCDVTAVKVPSTPVEELRALCAEASAIGVAFEAGRPSSGLNRLLTGAAFDVLKACHDKIFFVSDAGAFFDRRLSDLVAQVVPMVASASGFGDRPWFVYDPPRFDARYSDFIRLSQVARRDGDASREFARRWRSAGLSMLPPFQEASLTQAYARILTPDTEPHR